MDDHLRSLPEVALGRDRTATLIDDGGHVGKSQPKATHIVTLTRGDTVEAVNDSLLFALLHPDTVVRDRVAKHPLFVRGTDGQL